MRSTEGEVKLSSIAQDFVTAFLLTFSNVLIVFLYLGLFARFSFISSLRSIWETFLGIIGIVIGASLWWFLLTTAISLLRRWFTLRSLRLLNRIVGGIIILLSLIGLFLSLSPLLLSLLQDTQPQ
jgi:threonine/homoserine/homoserine lactone efflux protein